MVPTRLVLWDIDGTLLDAAGYGWRLADRAFRNLYGAPLVHPVPLAGRTDRAIMTDVLHAHGVPAAADDLIAEMESLVPAADDFHTGGGTVLAGAAEAISALAGEPSVVQSVLTGNLGPVARAKLAAVGLGDHLDLAVAAYGRDHAVRADLVTVARKAFTARYPAPAGFGTILIGDTPLDVAAAHAAGAAAIAVATGRYTAAELRAAGAAVVLPDLTDTARLVDAVRSV
ncbi:MULTISPECIES: haloacid dehalogenase-like hydrolase [Catenuloplanes]|uniref:Phosphoglycolate phosphatase-like HAD superfamily hydrolase n=1 Tax=Catenuloplanes niger TaxID=587534 RepID=A0AAE4CUL7_9ACTN|nr:haloacid dehalogenase-like hydrolase [Catenuloplanes niger]MDR7324537.1 phosphoglycolate phosphatase-like HAD superfamily hydrolase [Catenuloplanes niger]